MVAGPAWDLWIDYTQREPDGLTPTLLRYASPGVDVSVGAVIVVGAEDAELCDAEVVSIDGEVVMVRVIGPAGRAASRAAPRSSSLSHPPRRV